MQNKTIFAPMYIIPFILINLAAICDAIVDTCNHHFYTSIFNRVGDVKWNRFWNTEISWKNKYNNYDPKQGRRKIKAFGLSVNFPVQLTDSFHLFKTLRIVFWCLAVSFAQIFAIDNQSFYIWLGLFVGYGVSRNITFSYLYERVLIKK